MKPTMSKKASAFSMEVELRVHRDGGSLATTVLALADELELEEDSLPKYISESLKQKLYLEGINDRTIKPQTYGDAESISEWI